MIRLALRGLAARRTATALATLGLLTATLGFVVLASTSQTTSATLRGDLNRAWSTPYDILVRPPGSVTPLEQAGGLVRPNFLSSVNGGIAEGQLAAIRSVAGVSVAAPIAVAGYFYWQTYETVDLSGLAGDGPLTVLRVGQTNVADAGMSAYPRPFRTLLLAPHGVIHLSSARIWLEAGGQAVSCGGSTACFAPATACDASLASVCALQTEPPQSQAWTPSIQVVLQQPVVVAGVDPAAEAQVSGLGRCLTNGRTLRAAADVPAIGGAAPATGLRGTYDMPALISQHSFVDESVRLRVDRAATATFDSQGYLVGDAGWRPAADRSWTADQFYQSVFQTRGPGVLSASRAYFTIGDVAYTAGAGGLAARTVASAPWVFNGVGALPTLSESGSAATISGGSGDLDVPEAADSWFRGVAAERDIAPRATSLIPDLKPVGRYDPACVGRFDPLAGGPQEAYVPAAVTTADGRTIGPSASPAGYVSAPPSALTTLETVKGLEALYANGPGDAFISVVRVRVAGVSKLGPVAEAKLSHVAAAIRDATGLQVDIVRGASPRAERVSLPASTLGRPALTVTEPWSVEGVGFVFSRAVSAQDLALFVIVLVGACVLVGQTAYTSVRTRRAELGTLRAAGWPAWRVAALVETEMVLLALAAGAVAAVIGLLVRLPALQAALMAPLAVGLAAVATLGPAAAASRGSVVTVLRRAPRPRVSRPLRGAVGLGLRDLAGQWRGEALLGILVVALGSALVGGVALVGAAFRGQLDATVLGSYLAGQVRPFHLAIAGLSLAVGAIAVAEIVALTHLERRPHVGVLRALGWPRGRVAAMIGVQALALGVAGGGLGALAALAAGALLGASSPAVLTGMAWALGSGVLATAIAGAVPLTLAYRADPAECLRGE